jgi:hypothetical protein
VGRIALGLGLTLALAAAGAAAWLLLGPGGHVVAVGPPPGRPAGDATAHAGDGGAVRLLGDRVVLTSGRARWTVFTRCVPGLVGPGYVARVETRGGHVLVDDELGPGTLNDTDFGGLGAFAWHHSRGLPGQLRFTADNAWEVSVRTCAAENGGFGVTASRLLELGERSLAVAVELSDGQTYPEPLMRVEYRYEVAADALRSSVTVTELCGDGRCGRTDELAFLKEPKVVAHVGSAFERMDVLDAAGGGVCGAEPTGPEQGPILATTQCAAPGRRTVRFSPCAPACLEIEARGWDGLADGFDAWAVEAAARPAALAFDTPSIDGVLWSCHGGDPSGVKMRRWELAGRRGRSLGVLFPAWEGGRGGYDCEPLARTFGPRGETWRAFLTYALVG